MDLFLNSEKQPENLRQIIKSIPVEMDYSDLETLLKKVESIGYTFEYYLDAEPYNLRKMTIKERLEYIRAELRSNRISYSEILELQTLSKYIDNNDVELLEAAGIHESNN